MGRNFINDLIKHKTIIVIAIGLIGTFYTLQYKVDAQEKAYACTTQEINLLKTSAHENKKDIATIKNDIEWIKSSQAETSKDIKELIRVVGRYGTY